MSDPPEWVELLEAEGQLTPKVVDQVLSVHGSRGRRAIEGAADHRVKQYRDFTVVVGYRAEYIVEGETCTCEDTRFNLDEDDPTDRCWHRIAVDIANALDIVDEHDQWYSDLRDLL